MNIIALDPGYGNTKICVNGQVTFTQSAISRPQSIGLAGIGMKTAAQVRTIKIDGYEFAIGPGAWHWGRLRSSRDYSAIASPERRALAFGTLAEIIPPGEHTIDLMVVGLPVPLLQDQTQAEAVLGGLKAYKGEHRFSIDKADYVLNIQKLKALPQPVGAYANWLLDDELRQRKGGRQAEVGVLDLGMNTLDLYAIRDGQIEPRFVGGDTVGVRRLLELLTSNGHDPEEIDAALRNGRLKPNQGQLESWLGEVLSAVERVWPSLRRFSAVIPTGGGAVVLGDLFRAALLSKGAIVSWPNDPITANVLGLWKWGAHGVANSASKR
jgi:hypothetical protein